MRTVAKVFGLIVSLGCYFGACLALAARHYFLFGALALAMVVVAALVQESA